MRDKAPRSLAKTISWRACATITTISIVYIFTRELTLAAEVGAVEVIAKLFLYYFHERLWNWVSWGTKTHPLGKISVNSEVSEEHLEIIGKKLEELGYK